MEDNIYIKNILKEVNCIARDTADKLDSLNTDVDTALSVLAYADVKIIISQALVRGLSPTEEIERFCDMLKLASNTLDVGVTFGMN